MRLFIALLSCFVCARALDDFPFRFQTLDVIGVGGGEDASGLSGQSEITVATYCSEVLDSTFFDISYGDPDFINRFFCAEYLLDRRVQLTPRIVFPFFFFAETLLIPEHDREAKEHYLNSLNSLSASCYNSQLKAHICSVEFPPCDDAVSSIDPFPLCREFCTYTLGCHFDVEACRTAPRFEDDPASCDIVSGSLAP